MRKVGRRFFVGVAAVTVIVALAAGPAFAGKSGGTSATLTFTTSAGSSATTQVAVGSQYYVNGSGFKAKTWVTVGAHYADATFWGSGWTDGQGKITIGPYTAYSCGQIYHEGDVLNQHNGRMSLATGATLSVSC